MHVVCPYCHTTNRVPPERLTESPECGRCHQSLMPGHPVELNAEQFDKHLSRSDLPLLVDFWAPWCGPCRTVAPAFESAAAELEPHIRLVKVNTEEEQILAARYGIRSIPTLALFAGGREVARQAGAMGAPDIVRWARSMQARA
ncbi:thioredoxin [Noviherbaspirillum humi]|uniref:Thioredoxin n=1 Tax=Noviherbaspirillum humi TaxID=1688639 RepID=A0A239M6Y1_9BURK|nr:thioredoxin TrxC [Noviherbaspirillum humi]SNT37863.1 thioredoxin [Noviherbaspirillum humi]